jgi:hypothetical protein
MTTAAADSHRFGFRKQTAAASTAVPAQVPASGGSTAEELKGAAEAQSRAIMKKATSALDGNMKVINILKLGLLGALGGVAYAVALGSAADRGVLYELKHPTRAFDQDPYASRLFHELGKYEQYQPESYREAVQYCDKLFLLERSLTPENSRPSDADYPYACACIDGVIAHIILLRNKTPPELRGHVNILKAEISDVLRDHRRLLFNRCAMLRA